MPTCLQNKTVFEIYIKKLKTVLQNNIIKIHSNSAMKIVRKEEYVIFLNSFNENLRTGKIFGTNNIQR